MPPKRKRVIDHSDDDDQRDAKRLKTEPFTALPSLHSLPDDCLVEIFCHLPPLSVCSALLISKRYNSLFEALILKDLSNRFESTNKKSFHVSAAIKKQLSDILYPRPQYAALEQIQSTDSEILEKQLGWLQRWFALKLTEQQNVRQLKTKSPELWGHLHGRFSFKEHSPATTFTTREGTYDQVYGGTYRVSFILFGQSGHFAEIICDVLSYWELGLCHIACKLSMNAKLLSCDSTESTEVSDLLKGYKEANVPILDDEEPPYDREPDEQSEQFQAELDEGNRVSCKWFQTCFPELNQKTLNQVIEWLGWTVSALEMAQILVGLSQTLQSVRIIGCYDEDFETNEESINKYPDRPSDRYHRQSVMNPDASTPAKPAIIDTRDTMAALNQLLSLALSEDDEQSLIQLEQTLGLLEAKIKLQNRIRREWKDKDSDKLNQLMTLVDRSMYTSMSLHMVKSIPLTVSVGWTKMHCTFSRYSDDHDPNDKIPIRDVNGELKLFAEDSKWLRLKFLSHLEMPYIEGNYEGLYRYSLSTTLQQFEQRMTFDRDPLMLHEVDFVRFKNELGLDNFSDKELNELIKLIADFPENPMNKLHQRLI